MNAGERDERQDDHDHHHRRSRWRAHHHHHGHHGDPTTRPGAGLRTVLISLGVVASAMPVAPGRQVADPLVGLVLTLVILRITWQTWRSVRASPDSSTLIG